MIWPAMTASRITVLAGGVGGARFLQGLVDVVAPESVTVIGNVGDDVELYGLHVSPDLDTVLYTLTGWHDDARGWGVRGDTARALERAARLGAEAWFRLGDLDLGLHLVRTQALRGGEPLSSVTRALAEALGVRTRLVPATDDQLATFVETAAGVFGFQEWFVLRGHRDEPDAFRFEGADAAAPAPGVLEALAEADLLLIAPSNPHVSIWPILAVREIREALAARRVPCVAVSPLVGGRAVKGPADRMLARLAGGTSPAHLASCYPGLIDALVVDEADADDLDGLTVWPIVTRTLMTDADARRRLAEAAITIPA
jgi:LPPG:FO 2-phospho-L-lactate transferase